MKVLRSSVIAAVAIVAAACGDKVNVTGPTTTTFTTTTTTTPAVPGKVNSVSVAPATATLTVGQTINMTAAVQADAGVATTVTWSTSDATKVSVTTAGVATAVAASPGVAICATSTVNTSAKGCASIVVSPGTPQVPATATIAGVFQNSLNNPVDPSNVAGLLFVQVNVNAGTQTPSKLVLSLGGVRVDSQQFTAAQGAALRYASDQATAADQSSTPTVTLTVNTAAQTNGTPLVTNGSGKAVTVLLYVVGSTAVASTASNSTALTLNNPDKVLVTTTPTVAHTTGTDKAGYLWTRITDSLDVQLTYVSYSGRQPLSMAVTPVCNDTTFTKVLAPFKVRYAPASTGYVTQASTGACSATAATTAGETPIVGFGSVVMADGQAPAAGLAVDAASLALTARRYDNMGPAAPAIGRQDVGISGTYSRRSPGWMNNAVKLTSVIGSTEGSTAAFSGALITGRGADVGVSAGVASTDAQVVTYKAFVGSTLAAALASSAVTTLTGQAETPGFNSCLVVRSYDALQNVSAAPTSCAYVTGGSTVTIGVDNTAPNGAYTAAADELVNAALLRETADTLRAAARFFVLANDTATGGATGKSSVLGVRYAITATSGGTATCWEGQPASCTNRGNLTDGLENGQTTQANYFETPAVTLNGYYTFAATVYDGAGNALALPTRTVLTDATVPTAPTGTVNVPADVNRAATIFVSAIDDQDLGYFYGAMTYGALHTEKCSVVSIKSTFTGAPTPTVVSASTYTGCKPTHGSVIAVDANGRMPAAQVGARATLPTTGIGLVLRDYAGNQNATAAVAGSANALAPASAFGGDPGAANRCTSTTNTVISAGFCSFIASAAPTIAYTGAGVNAPTQVLLTATVVAKDSIALPATCGATNAAPVAACDAAIAAVNKLTVTPFTTVRFYVPDGSGTVVDIGAASAASTVAVDSATIAGYYLSTSTHVYTATFAPATTFGVQTPIKGIITVPGVTTWYAIGRYSTSSTATNKGIVASLAAASEYSIIADGTTKVAANSVKSKTAAITISK